MAHYDLKLHQIDVKNTFLNESLEETVNMDQPESFSIEEKEHLAYKLKKSIRTLRDLIRIYYISLEVIFNLLVNNIEKKKKKNLIGQYKSGFLGYSYFSSQVETKFNKKTGPLSTYKKRCSILSPHKVKLNVYIKRVNRDKLFSINNGSM